MNELVNMFKMKHLPKEVTFYTHFILNYLFRSNKKCLFSSKNGVLGLKKIMIFYLYLQMFTQLLKPVEYPFLRYPLNSSSNHNNKVVHSLQLKHLNHRVHQKRNLILHPQVKLKFIPSIINS
jgi:hypothetical protein